MHLNFYIYGRQDDGLLEMERARYKFFAGGEFRVHYLTDRFDMHLQPRKSNINNKNAYDYQFLIYLSDHYFSVFVFTFLGYDD